MLIGFAFEPPAFVEGPVVVPRNVSQGAEQRLEPVQLGGQKGIAAGGGYCIVQAAVEGAAKEPGAVKTPAGAIVRTVKPGTGATPQPTDRVEVHYTGKLLDGTVFDTSRKGDQKPVTFPLNGVIKCWGEGVGRMKVGEQAVLTCPADTAYGEGGQRNIPPGATLVFDVELVGIAK